MSVFNHSPAAALLGYCLFALLAALAGGALPALLKLTHTRLQLGVSFVAGLMLGLAVLTASIRQFETGSHSARQDGLPA